MERAFVVLRSRGPAWDDSKPLEAQPEWAAHAAFMDALFERGFAAFAGPLEGTRDALLEADQSLADTSRHAVVEARSRARMDLARRQLILGGLLL